MEDQLTASSESIPRSRVVESTWSPGTWKQEEALWETVLRASPDRSFFLSSTWVSCWLEVFGADLLTSLLQVLSADEIIATALISRGRRSRGGIPLRQLYLNTAGEPAQHSACVQYNAVPFHHGRRQLAYDALGAHLLSTAWDEFVVEGMIPAAVDAFRAALPGVDVDVEWRNDYFVDLAALRRAGTSHDSVLSRNTREQVRRSRKLYERRGGVRLTKPASVDEVLPMLEELAVLHQRSWQARGEPGSFASEEFHRFHRLLARRGFEDGSVQLLRVDVGEEPIGMLYSYAFEGVVSSYQSGFLYEADNRLKPGLLSHSLAIQHYMEEGYDSYHFLAGPETASRHKRSLSTHRRQLGWAVFRRPNFKNRVVDRLRAVKRFVLGSPPASSEVELSDALPEAWAREERRTWHERRLAQRKPSTDRRRSGA